MAFPDFKHDLMAAEFDAPRVLDRYFHSGQSMVFIGAPPDVEPRFKRDLAGRIGDELRIELHPLQLVVCGSAHLGFSPVPDKLGKPFHSETSDMDVAVVSTELFDRWWAELQQCDFVAGTRARIAEDLFWGFINPASVRSESPIGRQWWDLFGALETDRARGVRGRLYRNFWSMQNYHLHAINGGRKKLLDVRG